jgi:ACT domain-containing protein
MNKHESPIMYQNYYTVFGLFIGVLLAIALEKSNVWFMTIVLLGLSFYSLKEIYKSRYDFVSRTEFVEDLGEYGNQYPEGKYIINANNLPWDYLWVSWALPFETMISSEINPNLRSVTFYPTFEPDTLKDRDIVIPGSFLGAAFSPAWFNTSTINKAYFNVQDGPYRLVNTLQTEEMLTDSFINLAELKIIPESTKLIKKQGSTSIKITISNDTSRILASAANKQEGMSIYLNVLNQEGDTIRKELQKIIMDVPVHGALKQTIKYNHPIGDNNVMDLGFYLVKEKKYLSKAIVQLGNN